MPKSATLPAANTMFFAFLIGISTGFYFAPIALVPVSVAFLAGAAALAAYGNELDFEIILDFPIYLVILNVSYLFGAIARRWWATHR